jgi:hypothetical protein
MLGLVGDDGLLIAHNRGEYLRAFKVLHRYTGSSFGVHGTGEAYQITIMVGALGQYKACTEIWISHYTTPALCSFDPSPQLRLCKKSWQVFRSLQSIFTILHVDFVVRLFWFLRFVKLDRIVDVAQYPTHAILVLHV